MQVRSGCTCAILEISGKMSQTPLVIINPGFGNLESLFPCRCRADNLELVNRVTHDPDHHHSKNKYEQYFINNQNSSLFVVAFYHKLSLRFRIVAEALTV